MAKDKKRDEQGRFVKEEATDDAPTFFDPYVGAEEDDLSDMKYVQDSETVVEDTHPPATAEEAAAREEVKPVAEEEEADDGVQAEEEPEEEPEAEEEEVVAEAQEDEEPKIPKSRFDEVNEAKKKAQERVEKLEKQLEGLIEERKKPSEPEPEPFDYAAKEKEAYDAFLEGDTEKYSAIQQEIRVAEKADYLREAKRVATEGDQTVKEDLTFEETGARIESEYPAFVKTDESFNEDAYSDLMDLYVGYVNTGRYSRADALQMAADKAVRIYGLEKAGLAETAESNVVKLEKKKTDVKKKARVAESQPPIKESGTAREDEPTVDIKSMPDEEFEALPEATKRRLRGDIV